LETNRAELAHLLATLVLFDHLLLDL